MTELWDEFSKSLAQPVPRRESLRRLGFTLAGAVLSPLGLQTACAAARHPCNTFCKCRNKTQQRACLGACNACNGDTIRLCGTCGTYVCCRETGPWENGACIEGRCEYWCVEGATACDGACTFLDWDSFNCGACGNICPASTPYCNLGDCNDSPCAPGLTLCGDDCRDLANDFFNCGACGVVCDVRFDAWCEGGRCISNQNPPPDEPPSA
jgi:hypothetical protein